LHASKLQNSDSVLNWQDTCKSEHKTSHFLNQSQVICLHHFFCDVQSLSGLLQFERFSLPFLIIFLLPFFVLHWQKMHTLFLFEDINCLFLFCLLSVSQLHGLVDHTSSSLLRPTCDFVLFASTCTHVFVAHCSTHDLKNDTQWCRLSIWCKKCWITSKSLCEKHFSVSFFILTMSPGSVEQTLQSFEWQHQTCWAHMCVMSHVIPEICSNILTLTCWAIQVWSTHHSRENEGRHAAASFSLCMTVSCVSRRQKLSFTCVTQQTQCSSCCNLVACQPALTQNSFGQQCMSEQSQHLIACWSIIFCSRQQGLHNQVWQLTGSIAYFLVLWRHQQLKSSSRLEGASIMGRKKNIKTLVNRALFDTIIPICERPAWCAVELQLLK